MTAQELLRESLKEWFDDVDGFGSGGAGPDVGFDGLSGPDILRVWEYISTRSSSISTEPIDVQDRDNEGVPDPQPTFAEAVALVARGELGSVMGSLDGVESGGVLLPELRLELGPDMVSMYWWVGTGWCDAEAVAALAELLGELRELVPEAQLVFEGPDVDEFWGPVNNYVATTRRVREGLV